MCFECNATRTLHQGKHQVQMFVVTEYSIQDVNVRVILSACCEVDSMRHVVNIIQVTVYGAT